VQTGEFAKEWILENQARRPVLTPSGARKPSTPSKRWARGSDP